MLPITLIICMCVCFDANLSILRFCLCDCLLLHVDHSSVTITIVTVLLACSAVSTVSPRLPSYFVHFVGCYCSDHSV